MKYNELPDAVQRQLRNEQVKEAKKLTKTGKSWLSEVEDIRSLLRAIENNDTTVVLCGRTFTIEPRFHNGDKTWYVSPQSGFVPCGHFTVHTLNSELAHKEISGE